MVGYLDIEGSLTSPNIGNYYIGKGEVSIKLLGESQYTAVGNCPTFEFTAKVTQLDHYSSMTGVKVKDFTAVTEISGTLTMVLEEFTARFMVWLDQYYHQRPGKGKILQGRAPLAVRQASAPIRPALTDMEVYKA